MSKTVNKTSTGSLRGLSQRPKLGLVLMIALAVGITALIIYTVGYKSGQDNANQTATKQNDKINSSLLVVPAGGRVREITNKSITVQLLGSETRQAMLDNQTTVADKNGAAEVNDIKKGTTVILFTKQSGNDIIATRIIIQ